jgi:circadian clock protein KaiB
MERNRGKTSAEEFEKTTETIDRAKYVLRLYVTGMTPKSTQAIANVEKLCKEHLAGRYELEVIDIYQQPNSPCRSGNSSATCRIRKGFL